LWENKVKKTELKKVLKPLIKECIKECIFEDGVLSGIISEVIAGTNANVVRESLPSSPVVESFSRGNVELQESAKRDLQERRNKLENSVGGKFKGIFENVDPTPSPQSSSGQGPLSGYSPNDAGIDISGIFSLGGSNWKKMI
jgi:hypothetical protein